MHEEGENGGAAASALQDMRRQDGFKLVPNNPKDIL
jgi:hypothetical protein